MRFGIIFPVTVRITICTNCHLHLFVVLLYQVSFPMWALVNLFFFRHLAKLELMQTRVRKYGHASRNAADANQSQQVDSAQPPRTPQEQQDMLWAKQFRYRWGFLYRGVMPRYFYVRMLQYPIAFMVALQSGLELSFELQLLLLSGVLLPYVCFVLKTWPFQTWRANSFHISTSIGKLFILAAFGVGHTPIAALPLVLTILLALFAAYHIFKVHRRHCIQDLRRAQEFWRGLVSCRAPHKAVTGPNRPGQQDRPEALDGGPPGEVEDPLGLPASFTFFLDDGARCVECASSGGCDGFVEDEEQSGLCQGCGHHLSRHSGGGSGGGSGGDAVAGGTAFRGRLGVLLGDLWGLGGSGGSEHGTRSESEQAADDEALKSLFADYELTSPLSSPQQQQPEAPVEEASSLPSQPTPIELPALPAGPRPAVPQPQAPSPRS